MTHLNKAQAIQAGVDLDALFATAEKRVTVDVPVIFDADGEAKAGFRIVGKNSAEYQAEYVAMRTEGHKRAAKRRTAIDISTDDGARQYVDLVDTNQRRLAQAVIVETFGFQRAGEDVQLSREQIVAAFEKFPTWESAVLAALEKDADFLKV